MILVNSCDGMCWRVEVLVIFRKCESKSQIPDLSALLWGVGSKSGFCGFLIKMVFKIKVTIFEYKEIFDFQWAFQRSRGLFWSRSRRGFLKIKVHFSLSKSLHFWFWWKHFFLNYEGTFQDHDFEDRYTSHWLGDFLITIFYFQVTFLSLSWPFQIST